MAFTANDKSLTQNKKSGGPELLTSVVTHTSSLHLFGLPSSAHWCNTQASSFMTLKQL